MKKNDFISEFRAKYSYISVENFVIGSFFDNFYSENCSLEINFDRCQDYILSQGLEDEVVE